MENSPDVEMDWKCRRRVTASTTEWPLPPPDFGLVMALVPPVPAPPMRPAPAIPPALVTIREPTMLPATRTPVTALVAEEACELSARMSLGDSSGESTPLILARAGPPSGELGTGSFDDEPPGSTAPNGRLSPPSDAVAFEDQSL